MKNINLKIVLILFCTAIIFVSCTNEGSIGPKYKDLPLPQITYNPSIWNPNNPYDSIGFYHNEIMEYIAINRDELDTTDLESFKESIGVLISDYISINLGESVNGDSLILGAESTFSSFENKISMEDWINQTFTDSAVAENLNAITEQVMSIEDNETVLNIIVGIKDIEDDVANSSLTSGQKKLIFTYSSICKFSLVYWTETYNDPNSEWREWWSETHPNSSWDETVPLFSPWSVLADAAGGVGAALLDDPWYECIGHAVITTGFCELAIFEFAGGFIAEGIAAVVGGFLSFFGL